MVGVSYNALFSHKAVRAFLCRDGIVQSVRNLLSQLPTPDICPSARWDELFNSRSSGQLATGIVAGPEGATCAI
jgi:hypothetical protein